MTRALSAWAFMAVMSAAGALQAQSGVISTYAGNGSAGFAGDNGAATAARVNSPRGLAIHSGGHVYLADSSNNRIRRVDVSSGIITTVAGTSIAGFNGDGIVATAARLNLPRGIVFDSAGHLFISDSRNHRIRRVDAVTGLISTVAGTGTLGYNGDDILATTAQISEPGGMAIAADGDLLFAEVSGARVRRVDADTGKIFTVAGLGANGFNGDGIPAPSASLNTPMGVAIDGAGNIYIADTGNARVRRVDAASGVISTAAGTGTFGFNGDGIAATAAHLMSPSSVTVDAWGHLYVADVSDHRVRRVDATTGQIATIAGTGVAGYNGDGMAATIAQVRGPDALVVNADGHLFVTEVAGARVRRIEGASTPLNREPTAEATLTLAGSVCGASGGTLVQLSGAGSSDPDLDQLIYVWTGPFPEGGGTVTGMSPVVTMPLGGPHAVTLVVTDDDGASDSTSASISIADTASPFLSIEHPSITVPRGTGNMTAVDVLAATGAAAVDACDPNPVVTVHGPDLFLRGSTTLVQIEARDVSGNAAWAEIEITVEQGGRPADPGPPAGKKGKGNSQVH